MFPQEARSWRPAVRPERRREHAGELEASAPDALALLASLPPLPPPLAAARLEAFAGWVRLGVGRADGGGPSASASHAALQPAALAAHSCTAAAVAALDDPQVFESGVEALSELVRAAEPPPPHHHHGGGAAPDAAAEAASAAAAAASAPLVNAVVPPILAQRARFASPSCDPDEARGLARLFAEVGEAFLSRIAGAASAADIEPAVALLAVAAHSDEDVASASGEFWSRLASALGREGDGALPVGEGARRRGVFAPAFSQLVSSLAVRARVPPGFGGWRRSERAEWRRSRAAVADTLLSVAHLIGGDAALQHLAAPLSPPPGGAPSDPRTIEASLFAIRAIAAAPFPEACPLLHHLLLSLPALHTSQQQQQQQQHSSPPGLVSASAPLSPDDGVDLGAAACSAAAEYAQWAAASPDAATLLPPLLSLAVAVMAAGGVAGGCAAEALRALCDAAPSRIAPLLPQLLPSLVAVLDAEAAEAAAAAAAGGGGGGGGGGSSSAAAAAARPSALDPEDITEVVQALGALVPALQPEDAQPAALAALLAPFLSAASPHPHPAPPDPPLAAPRAWDRVAAVFRSASAARGPCATALITSVWPLAASALSQSSPPLSERDGERICRALKYALRAGGPARCAQLQRPAQDLLSAAFAARRHACLLFFAGEVAREFGGAGGSGEQRSSAAPFLASLLLDAASFLSLPGVFAAAPDVGDDCFLLAERTLRLLPDALVPPQQQQQAQQAAASFAHLAPLCSLLFASSVGVVAQHREASSSCARFVSSLLRRRSPPDVDALRSALPPLGAALVASLLYAALVVHPLWKCEEIGDALAALLSVAGDAALGWLHSAASRIPRAAAEESDVAAFWGAARACADASAPPVPHLLPHAGANGGGAPPPPVNPSVAAARLGSALETLGQLIRRNPRSFDATATALGQALAPAMAEASAHLAQQRQQ